MSDAIEQAIAAKKSGKSNKNSGIMPVEERGVAIAREYINTSEAIAGELIKEYDARQGSFFGGVSRADLGSLEELGLV